MTHTKQQIEPCVCLQLCTGPAFEMFRPEELELLICGGTVLDFTALQHATLYANGFSPDSRVRSPPQLPPNIPAMQQQNAEEACPRGHRLEWDLLASSLVAIPQQSNLARRRKKAVRHRVLFQNTCFHTSVNPPTGTPPAHLLRKYHCLELIVDWSRVAAALATTTLVFGVSLGHSLLLSAGGPVVLGGGAWLQ